MSLLIRRKWARRAPSRFRCYVLPLLYAREHRITPGRKKVNGVRTCRTVSLYPSTLQFAGVRLSFRERAETNSRNEYSENGLIRANLNGRLFLEGQFEWTNLGVHSTIIHKIELQRGFLSEYASMKAQAMKFWLFMAMAHFTSGPRHSERLSQQSA